MDSVDVLLSTYNGVEYVDELLESVLQQKYPNIHLLIRDDGSSDGTIEKISEWKRRYPEKITLIQDKKGNIGVTRSMLELLGKSEASYSIFCDQDDVWFPDKVSQLVKGMHYKEKQYPDAPVIVHCEAYTTDTSLKLIDPQKEKALHAYQSGRNKMQTSFANLLLANPVQGASMLCNRRLREEMLPLLNVYIPKDIVYDSLAASVCSIRGKIFFLNRPLMYYRQHARNVVGAERTTLIKLHRYDEGKASSTRTSNYLLVNKKKCEMLKKHYMGILTDKQKKILMHYLESPNNWMEFWKLGLYKEFTMRQILIMMAFGIHY